MPFSIWGYSFNDTYYESTQILMNTYQGTYRFNRFGILLSKPGALAFYGVYLERDKHKKNVTSLEAEWHVLCLFFRAVVFCEYQSVLHHNGIIIPDRTLNCISGNPDYIPLNIQSLFCFIKPVLS